MSLLMATSAFGFGREKTLEFYFAVYCSISILLSI